MTWDEVAGLIEDETGLDARPVADSGQRVVFGGREADPEVLGQAGVFRDRLRASSQEQPRLGEDHHGVVRCAPGWRAGGCSASG